LGSTVVFIILGGPVLATRPAVSAGASGNRAGEYYRFANAGTTQR